MKKAIRTRFRAYQLGSAGSSFSYCAGGHFTLIEARLTDVNRSMLLEEMRICGADFVDTLHITSWDADHCSSTEIEELLNLLRPSRIECPGYPPHTQSGMMCRKLINAYRNRSNKNVDVKVIDPDYIMRLNTAGELGYKDVLYHPRFIDPNSDNNNSTVKLFRRGCFNVLSLGDVESENLSARLRRDKYLSREVDVLILAHHGANNGFANKKFLRRIQPKVAICSSNYDNQFDHPRQEIRKLLYDEGVKLFTTKTGDIVVDSIGPNHDDFVITNLIKGSTEVSSQIQSKAKKQGLLSMNMDTVKQLFTNRRKYPR